MCDFLKTFHSELLPLDLMLQENYHGFAQMNQHIIWLPLFFMLYTNGVIFAQENYTAAGLTRSNNAFGILQFK